MFNFKPNRNALSKGSLFLQNKKKTLELNKKNLKG